MAPASELKKMYVDYYRSVPVQRYAAMYIGRDEDTVIRWRKEDQNFADAVEKAKAEWVRKKVMATKAEFALERLEREVFNPNATDLRVQIESNIVYLPSKLPDDYDEVAS